MELLVSQDVISDITSAKVHVTNVVINVMLAQILKFVDNVLINFT